MLWGNLIYVIFHLVMFVNCYRLLICWQICMTVMIKCHLIGVKNMYVLCVLHYCHNMLFCEIISILGYLIVILLSKLFYIIYMWFYTPSNKVDWWRYIRIALTVCLSVFVFGPCLSYGVTLKSISSHSLLMT